MPRPTHPRRRDHFVYWFTANSYPFYVGIGRDKRARDRIRYVDSLCMPHNRARLARECLHIRVMAELRRRGIDVRLHQTRKPLTRKQALALEKPRIIALDR